LGSIGKIEINLRETCKKTKFTPPSPIKAYLTIAESDSDDEYYAEPDVVKYDEDSKPQYDLILGTETMKELGIVLDFKAKMITVDEITVPMRNINHLQRYRILQMLLKHNNSLAKEPMSMQDATSHAIRILDAKYDNADLQSIVKNICEHLSADQQNKLLQLLMILTAP
jgi:hypothetical protein